MRDEVSGAFMLEPYQSLNLPRPVSTVKGTGILLVIEKDH